MKQGYRHGKRRAGFSLIEIIVTIMLMGIAATTLVTFLNATLSESHKAYTWVYQEADMGTTIEDITADYIRDVNSNSTFNVSTFYGNISTTVPTGNKTIASITKQLGCFNSGGNFTTAGCTTSDVILVTVVEKDGRHLTTLFTKSRDATDPVRVH